MTDSPRSASVSNPPVASGPVSGTASDRKFPRGLLIGAGLLGLALLIYGLRQTVLAPDPLVVRVGAVSRGLVEATVTNSKAGTVAARRRSRIASEIGGRVVEVARREGDRVKQGEVLVRLADVSFSAQAELARQGVAVSRARLEDQCLRRDRAQREFARIRELAERNVVSADRLDALQYAYDSARVACQGAKAELAQAEARRVSAEADLAKTTINAPFDGIVAEVNVEVGEWVTPSPPLLTSPSVVDLIDPRSIYVSAPMDEVDSGEIRAGLPVKLTIDSKPGQTFRGKVSRVAPYVVDLEAQNRTLEIEVELDDRELSATLLPGTSADAEVILESRKEVLRVPTSALLQNQKVLVLEDGRLAERGVVLGLRNWQFAEVESGLSEGEPIVISLDRVEIEAGVRAVAEDEEGYAVIRVENLWRTYTLTQERSGRDEEAEVVHALRGVNESIEDGEHVAIMGPSGSGKSTLLNVLGCLDSPTRGTYFLAGEDVAQLPEEALAHVRLRRIGFIFQSFHLVPRLTALENVALPMVFGGVDPRERRSRALAALDAVGLSDRAQHRPGELSGGQKQRIAIARATIMNPGLLLADEPTGNLDSRSGQQVLDLLGDLHRAGRTLVVVTHDPDVARRADRVLIVRDGEIVRRLRGAEVTDLGRLFDLGPDPAPEPGARAPGGTAASPA